MSFDAAVIGAGPNGLAAAVALARRGASVVVLERWSTPGGPWAEHTLHPGYRVPGIVPACPAMPGPIAEVLELADHGLQFRDPPATWVAPPGGEGSLVAHDTVGHGLEADAEAYGKLRAWLARIRPFLLGLLTRPVPPLASGLDAWPALQAAWSLRRLGERDMTELLRFAPGALHDMLDERFTDERLRVALALPALRGTCLGPRSPTTNAGFLFREALAGWEIAGGPPALIRALLAAAESLGVTLRCGWPVERIRVEKGRAVGVIGPGGEAIEVPRVFAACDPRQALLDLVDPLQLPAECERVARTLRARGALAKVHLALSAPLVFRGCTEPPERAVVAVDLRELERASDAVLRGEVAAHLPLEVEAPTLTDASLAPEGHHVVAVLVHGVGGSADREALGRAVIDRLAEVAPGVRDQLIAHEVLTPADLAERWALPGGHLYHAELALDQLWVGRPAFGLSGHATPIEGLYLASVGVHPGPVPCGAGVLAVEAAMTT